MNSKSIEIQELEEQIYLLQERIKVLEYTLGVYDNVLLEYKELVFKLLQEKERRVLKIV